MSHQRELPLRTEVHLSRRVDDVKAAVRWLRANAQRLKIDPERIGAVGDSAGGHLSMMLGTTGEEPEFGADHENPGFRAACNAWSISSPVRFS